MKVKMHLGCVVKEITVMDYIKLKYRKHKILILGLVVTSLVLCAENIPGWILPVVCS